VLAIIAIALRTPKEEKNTAINNKETPNRHQADRQPHPPNTTKRVARKTEKQTSNNNTKQKTYYHDPGETLEETTGDIYFTEK